MTTRTLLSRLFVPTSKDISATAQAASHQLMLRAGLIRQVCSCLIGVNTNTQHRLVGCRCLFIVTVCRESTKQTGTFD
jgi:hypothetical protein